MPVSDSFCLLMFSSLLRVNFQNIPGCSLLLLAFFFFPFDSFLPFYFLFLAGRGGRESLQSIIQRREVVLCPTVKEGKREPFDSLFMFRLHVLLF